jgi:hypothetical protein
MIASRSGIVSASHIHLEVVGILEPRSHVVGAAVAWGRCGGSRPGP